MKRSTTKKILMARLLPGVALALACSCTIGGPGGYKMGVPYVPQDANNHCTAASVLMWRLYDGLPNNVTQDQIMQGMGLPVKIYKVADAVRSFTSRGDAYWDEARDPQYYEMVSRQVASVSNAVPVLPVVRFDHTGILDGGSWHDGTSARYVWDFVYFHDPDPGIGGDTYLGATDWLINFCAAGQGYCEQVVAAGAVFGWEKDLADYGSRVRVAGGGRQKGPYGY